MIWESVIYLPDHSDYVQDRTSIDPIFEIIRRVLTLLFVSLRNADIWAPTVFEGMKENIRKVTPPK